MNWDVILPSAFTALCALLGTWMSNRKQSAMWEYRLTQLEKKLDRHNGFEARIVALETDVKNLKG